MGLPHAASKAIILLLLIAFLLFVLIAPSQAGGMPPGGGGGWAMTPTPVPAEVPLVGGGGQLTWWRSVWTVERGIRSTRISLRGFVITSAHRPVVGWRLTCELWKNHTRITCDNYPRFAPPPIDMALAAESCGGSPYGGARQYQRFIRASSKTYSVPTRTIAAVLCVESKGHLYANSCTYGTDYFCSLGLMQLIPSTCATVMAGPFVAAYSAIWYSWLNTCYANLFDAQFNINAGTKYLRQQYNTYRNYWPYGWAAAAGFYNCGSCVTGSYVTAYWQFALG
jgi:hypothetical protein